MKVSVFGLGYVGTVSAACLARDGHRVIGVDVNRQKINTINQGRSPVIEPGLEELVRGAVREGRLSATDDVNQAVADSEISLICVGTPSNGNGSLDVQYLENVCRQIGAVLADKREYHVVVVRSTVLPSTVEERLTPLLCESSGKAAGEDFGVAMNPEFLRESCAIADYDDPCQIVIGQWDQRSGDAVDELYRKVNAERVRTPIKTAEMVKYVNNAFHALKVVFGNEIGGLCKAHGIDGQQVMDIFCRDRRLNISPAYLRPGFAFGGSCLPKDLRALVYQAKQLDVQCPVLSATLDSNQRQVQRGIELIERIGRRNVGVLGLSFKAGTDDVRESPMVPLIETLVGRGYQLRVYDETVVPEQLIGANKSFLQRELPHIASLMRPSLDGVVEQSDVLVIGNGSKSFRRIGEIARPDQTVVDLVGICKPNGQNGHTRNGSYEGICW